MPKATVLIPTFNCGKFIETAITSIITQSFKDFDILVIDDGSTDNTEQIIDRLNIKNLNFLKNEKNLGIVDTLNRGIEIINSPYIMRMDADDVMLPGRIESQLKFLDHNLEYGMVGSWYHIIDLVGKKMNSAYLNTEHDFLKLFLIFSNSFAHASVTMRTELAKTLRYDKEFQYCEDHELWVRFSKVSKISNLPQFHLAYRKHPESTCSQKQRELKIIVLNLLSRELDELGVNHSEEELMLHGAACFGQGRILYKDPKNRKAIDRWYDRIFDSEVLTLRYNKMWLKDFRNQITARLLT